VSPAGPLLYEACMLKDPSADEMMDCHPCHSPLRTEILPVLKKGKKLRKKRKGLLATLKQIIGRGFVF